MRELHSIASGIFIVCMRTFPTKSPVLVPGLVHQPSAAKPGVPEGTAGVGPERERLRQVKDVQRADAGLGMVPRDAHGAPSRSSAGAHCTHRPDFQGRSPETR